MKMESVLAFESVSSAGRHDVSGRIYFVASRGSLSEDPIIAFDVELSYIGIAEVLDEEFPRVDPIEELEEQDSKKCVVLAPFVISDDAPHQILAHAIGRAISVGESVNPQYWIVGPRRRLSLESPKINLLSLDSKTPVARERLLVCRRFLSLLTSTLCGGTS